MTRHYEERILPVTGRVMRRFESSGRARYARAHDAFHSVYFGERESVINLTSHVLRRFALSIGGKLKHPRRGNREDRIPPNALALHRAAYPAYQHDAEGSDPEENDRET